MSKRIPPDEPPFAWQRLYKLIDALRSGVKLTGKMREEIALALEYMDGEVFAFHWEQSMRTPGRPRSWARAWNASLVHVLVEDYGARVKAQPVPCCRWPMQRGSMRYNDATAR